MFDNIGGKLKGLATFICWGGIICSMIFGIMTIGSGGLFVMICGCLFSWIGSFLLYGFGQLVENSDKLVAMATGQESTDLPEANQWTCPDCGKVMPDTLLACTACGTHRYTVQKADHPDTWTCCECGYENLWHVGHCNNCGISKAWSEAKTNQN